MICVTTRFHFRSFWQLLPVYLAYRNMQTDLKAAPGLIRYAFSLESPRVVHTFSIWESRHALELFSNAPGHLHAVRLAKRHCEAIWSAYWQFDAVSKYACTWPARTNHSFSPNRFEKLYRPEEATP